MIPAPLDEYGYYAIKGFAFILRKQSPTFPLIAAIHALKVRPFDEYGYYAVKGIKFTAQASTLGFRGMCSIQDPPTHLRFL